MNRESYEQSSHIEVDYKQGNSKYYYDYQQAKEIMSNDEMPPIQGQGHQNKQELRKYENPLASDRQLISPKNSQKKNEEVGLESTPSTSKSLMKLNDIEGDAMMPQKKKISMMSAVFILNGCAANPGMVALMPFAYTQVGIAQGYLFTLFSLWIQCVTIYFLIVSQKTLNVLTYPDLAARQCGKRMKICLSILSCIALLGASVAATVFSRNIVHEVVTSNWEESPYIIQTHYFWVIVLAWVIIFPLLTCPRLGGLKQVSFVASLLPVLFCFVMFASLTQFSLPNVSDITWFRYDLDGMILAFTLIFYPTQIQLSVQQIFNEMQNPTTSRAMIATVLSLLMYYIPCMIVGTIGYLILYSEQTDLLVIENMFKVKLFGEWLPAQISGILFLFTTLTMVLLLMMTFKILLIDLIKKKCKPTCCLNVSMAAAIALICTLLASAIQKTSVATRLIGATLYPVVGGSHSQMAIIFPSLFYLCSQRRKKNTLWVIFHKAAALFLVMFIGSFALYGSIIVPMETFS